VTVRHVIFDCDGVLVDSEPLSMRVDVMLLRRHGVEMSEAEAHRRFVGKTFEAMVAEISRQHGISFPPGLSAEKDRRLEEMYVSDLNIVEGVRDVLDDFRVRGVSFSVASNSPRKRVALALQLTGITDFFDRIVTFEDVANGKPAPDVFLKAAALSGVAAGECLVVEDSTTGVTAAVAAGLPTVGFTGTHHEPEVQGAKLLTLGAMRVIAEMRELRDFH
jgi:HAD superfamily hydrolase (TIGR01509 family)